MKRRLFVHLGFGLLCLIVIAALWAVRTPAGAALFNVIEYRVRAWWWSVMGQPSYDPARTGSLAGVIRTEAGEPLANAVALVATVRGEVFEAHSDADGAYRITGAPPGRYTPMSGAWGFVETNGPPVSIVAGQTQTGVDFTLAPYQPAPVEPRDLVFGASVIAASTFPSPLTAARTPFTFTLDGLTIEGGQFYRPLTVTGALPTLFVVYPSPAINWDGASAAMADRGFAVIAVGPDGERGLDIEGHVRDVRAVFGLWQEGRFAEAAPDVVLDSARWLVMSGSFGSLMLFRALRDLPPAPAIVSVGGISDAFLGVRSLYSSELKIPPPYDSYVAALGRPDRDPAFFFRYSPLYYVEHLPPIFIVHSYGDEVIPYNQSEVLDAALTARAAPHETLLYHDTTHYLDAQNPTEATHLVFRRVMDFVAAHTPE